MRRAAPALRTRLTLLVVCLGIVAIPSLFNPGASARVRTATLVAQYKFDEGGGALASDSTANGNSAALQNATWTASMIGPGGLDFNGANAIVTVPASAALDSVADNFTVSFWAYPRSPHEIDQEGYVWGGTSGQRYALGPRHEAGSDAGVGVSVGTNGVSVYEHGDNYMPASLVYQGALSGWTYVAVVYENKQPRL